MNVERLTLPNGLRIVHHRDTATAMVAVNVLYDVGARDEQPSMTGIAHLFEHLMFGGSINIPEFDTAIERAGGTDNAWTSNDFTNFYDVMPAQNAETAFWLESDRMLSPAFTEKGLEIQKNVVIEEFKQTCLNRPYGDTAHHLRRLAYTVHPYRWPVIGIDPSHIANVTLDDARNFFHTHYGPQNAILSVAGNITADETFKLAEKWFGDIPRREIATRNLPAEPRQNEARRLVVEGDVPATAITIGYKMGDRNSPHYRAADILTDILSSGRSSRFYRDLFLKTGLFTDIDASILGSEDAGLLLVTARLTDNDNDTLRRAEEAIASRLAEVVADGVTDFELQRALNRFESDNTFSNISYLSKATALAMAEIHREDINRHIETYRQLTVDRINTTAREILQPEQSSTIIYRPRQ